MKHRKKNLRRVEVVDGNVDGALKKLNDMMKQDNVFYECYKRRYYSKPSDIRRRQVRRTLYNVRHRDNN